MTLIAPQRYLGLEGSYNTRDIGGYSIEGGGWTQWRKFLRSDGMHRLTAGDQEKLVAYGVRAVIDLRTPYETVETPNVFAESSQVAYHHCDIIGDAPALITPEQVSAGLPVARIAHSYTTWLDARQAQFAEVLGMLAEPGYGPAVYHCAGGKDRTGIISALLLGLAGVGREVILDDYTLTSIFHFRRAIMGGASAVEKPVLSASEYEDEYCPREGMARTLAHLDNRYGGIEAYVRAIGLTEGQIEALRETLTE